MGRVVLGAIPRDQGTFFRVWAPAHRQVEVIFADGRTAPLSSEAGGYFAGEVANAAIGDHYKFRLDGELARTYPDPASRFQPDGPHGYSEIVSNHYAWSDAQWRGLELPGQVIYELHVGTFTQEGTWRAATRRLPDLASLGITVIEVMPVADFVGEFGWGYDGVNLFAPTRLYGGPDEFRHFIDVAHGLKMAVILDVVYNHLGPDGNFLAEYSPDYFTSRYSTDWGAAINYDGHNSRPVRDFYLANAAYWLDEFHLDGLRVDATQNIYDAGTPNILAELSAVVREQGGNRRTLLIAENEPQDSRLVRSSKEGGFGFDGMWNDDFHHSAMVALTGRREAYFTDYDGSAREFLACAKYGFLYQGQYYSWQKATRGQAALGMKRGSFVNFIQNHDQIANTARGLRAGALTGPGHLRAVTACLLLMPGTPMLFQGQEFGATTPFLFFSDHKPEIADLVRRGRAEFLAQYKSLQGEGVAVHFSDPCAQETFERCKLDHSRRDPQLEALHRTLLRLRREDPVLHRAATDRVELDGAVLGEDIFLLRYFDATHGDRLLVVNLGPDYEPRIVPEPLLAPPGGSSWEVVFSTEEWSYGGSGTYDPAHNGQWRVQGQSAVLLRAQAGGSAS